MIYGLTLAAVLPALFLLVMIYKADKKEKEPLSLIVLLVLLGIVAALAAIGVEKIGIMILNLLPIHSKNAYNFLLYFIIIAPAEECLKQLMLQKGSWKHSAFNCLFDGIVYGVSVSLGFALFENLLYTFRYGIFTAISRSLTAIPAHASYGVFMGLWYGLSKQAYNQNQKRSYAVYHQLTWLMPILIHGLYDFCLVQTGGFSMCFLVFILLLFTLSYQTVKRVSYKDKWI